MNEKRKQLRSLKMETKMTPILRIRKKALTFLGHIIKKKSLENLILTRHIDGKRNKERQQATQLTRLCEWIVEQGMAKIHR